jgi:fatty-acyl-CoA synthase
MKTNFCHVMAAIALRYRDNIAVVNTERNRRYTFREYHLLTNRVANMARDTLGLRAGDTAMLILENDSLSLIHFPAIFKQEAMFAFCNIRDSPEEHARQIDHVNPKVVFIETRMLRTHYDMLRGKGCAIVVMEGAPDIPEDVLCFNDLNCGSARTLAEPFGLAVIELSLLKEHRL